MFRLFAGSVATVYLVGVACAGNEVFVGRRMAATTAFDRIDHSVWDTLLKKYVDDDGMVNYRAWHSSSADTQALDQYLSTLSTLSTGQANQATTNGKLAFWINAYNAATIRGILRE